MSRLLAKSKVLLRFPPGSKRSEGTGMIATSLKDLLNSSQPTRTSPRAGSFSQTHFPLKPSSTTKWFRFDLLLLHFYYLWLFSRNSMGWIVSVTTVPS